MIRRLAISVLVIAALAPVLSGDAAPPVLIPQGVTVAGFPVGGMSNEQAQAALRPAFAEPVRLAYGDRAWRLVPSRFGATVTIERGVADALGAQAGDSVELVPAVDDEAVRTFVRALDRRTRIRQGRRADGPEGTAAAVLAGPHRPPGAAPADGAADRARAAVADDSPDPCRSEGGRTDALGGQVRAGDRDPPRRERVRYYQGAKLVRKFGVATGQAVYPTPTGMFTIVDMQRNPWWRPPDSDWAKGLDPIPPGPGNPLGTRWMGLTAPGVGIHGTPDDASIGYSASHGCIRMHISDAEWVFQHVKLGTPVVITDV